MIFPVSKYGFLYFRHNEINNKIKTYMYLMKHIHVGLNNSFLSLTA